MPDSTDEFFDMLSRRRHEPLLEKVDATVRFDVADGDRIEHWRVQIGGYERSVTRYPVRYPTACSPQAWSTGAPLLLLRTMLGLEPTGEHLVVDPALPVGIGRIELLDIPGRWGHVDAFGRGLVEVDLESQLHPQPGGASAG